MQHVLGREVVIRQDILAEILFQGILVQVVAHRETLAESAKLVRPHHQRFARRFRDGNAEQFLDHGKDGDQKSRTASEYIHGYNTIFWPRVECHLRLSKDFLVRIVCHECKWGTSLRHELTWLSNNTPAQLTPTGTNE